MYALSYVAYMYAYDIIVVQIIASMFTIMSAIFFLYLFYCLLCKSKHSTNIPVRTLFPPPPPSSLTVFTTYLYMPQPTPTHQYTPPSSHNNIIISIVEPLYSGHPLNSLKCPD